MKRTAGVTAAAVVLFIGSGFIFLGALATAVAAVFVATGSHPLGPAGSSVQIGTLAFGAVLYSGLAVWGVCTGVGILRLRPWARISILVMGAVAIVGCFLSLGTILLLLPPLPGPRDPEVTSILRLMLVGMLGLPGVIAVWWLILFLRPGVRQQFQDSLSVAPVSVAPAEPLLTTADPVAAPARRRPVSITVIAILLLLSVPFMTGSLYMSQSASAAPLPAFVLGWLITGRAAMLYYLAFMSASLVLGVGLWWMKPWARLGAIVLYAFSAINVVALALRPAAFAQILSAANSANTLLPGFSTPPAFVWLMASFSAVIVLVVLWFLIKSKDAFSGAAATL